MYHILIVDEEEHLLWALERNLFPERDDVQVHSAGSGDEGLQILEDQSIDLLISDIKMPGEIDGFQLILRAKEKVPDARVMIITAFGTHRIKNFAERIGISHYIEKPFTVDELRNAILEILDEKEGFQGVLSDLELTDIIQMLCLAKRTALLHLKHRDHRGRIVFDAGDVVHAQFDGEVGPEAVYAMLDLRQGDIFMQSDFEPVDRTIDMGWQDMLLEGVKRTDEQRLERQQEQTRQDLSDGDWERDSEGRTKTPMGMGAPTMSEGPTLAEASESTLEEASGGMLFSEAELEEISKASEAAIEERKSDDEDYEDDAIAVSDDEIISEEPAPEYEEEPKPESEIASEPESENPPQSEGQAESTPAPKVGAEEQEEPQGTPRIDEHVVSEDDGEELVDLGQDTDEQTLNSPDDAPAVVASDGSDADDWSRAQPEQEEAPTVEVSKEMFAVAVQQAQSAGKRQEEEAIDSDEETASNRERHGTSPGMAAVSAKPPAAKPPEGLTTEESGEFELFAAPALNGRTSPVGHQGSASSQVSGPAMEEFIEECPGLKATALVSMSDGEAMEFVNLGYDDGLAREWLTNRVAEAFGRAQRSVRALDPTDEIEELQLIVNGDYLLVRALNNRSQIHLAIVDREVSLGIALVLMRQFARQVRQDQ